MPATHLVQEFRDRCTELVKLNASLVHDNPSHGQMKMPELKDMCVNIQGLCTRVKAAPWTHSLPDHVVRDGTAQMNNALVHMRNAATINFYTEHNPTSRRNEAINSVTASYNAVVNWFAIAVASAREIMESPDAGWTRLHVIVDEASSKAGQLQAKIQKTLNDSELYTKEAKERIDAIIASAEIAAAQTVATKQSEAFNEAASQHASVASKWFAFACLFLATTGLVTWLLLWPSSPFTPSESVAGSVPSDASGVKAIRESVASLALVIILFLMSNTCFRNYRANKHLAVTNEHRARALKTFHAFASAARDDKTQSFVLVEATRCIFGRVPTGYLSKEGESLTPLLEAIKSVK